MASCEFDNPISRIVIEFVGTNDQLAGMPQEMSHPDDCSVTILYSGIGDMPVTLEYHQDSS